MSSITKNLRKKSCIFGCDKLDVHEHRFPHPLNNFEWYSRWVTVLGDKLQDMDPMTVYNSKRVCDYHFKPEEITAGRRVIFGAIPTLNLSGVFQSKYSPQREHNYASLISGASSISQQSTVCVGESFEEIVFTQGTSDKVGISEKVLLAPETVNKESLFFIYMQPETNLQTAKSPSPPPYPKMSKRTGFPTTTSGLTYRGLVENMSIPAELHERPDGKPYASFGSTVPIHCCTPEQVEQLAKTTHHYCDIFTEQLLAPLGELVYVRIDENTAEKVFINRSKRLLLRSSDGSLSQWRFAPTFESANVYVAGTPIVNQAGNLVSVVTAKKGNHYAVSTFEGEGGYFETTESWKVRSIPEDSAVYGDKTFSSREELRSYVSSLPAPGAAPGAPTPILYVGHTSRIVLVAKNGRQISHQYLHGVITTEIDYV